MRWRYGASMAGVLGLCGPAIADEKLPASVPGAPAPAEPGGEALADPPDFFRRLAERYRGLSLYEDTAEVVEAVERPDGPPHWVQTRIACRLEAGRLHVETPGEQVRSGIGLDVAVPRSPAMESLVLKYNLWRAPHLALHYLKEPLAEFRAGVPEGFTVARAEKIEDGGHPLVRLRLEAAAAPDETARDDDDQAVFVLWVDPESMLILRLEGAQTLPDGARYRTALRITPVRAE